MRHFAQLLPALAILPVAIATGAPLPVDDARVVVEAEVRATAHAFIARVAEPKVELEGDRETGRITGARIVFRWDALKTGNAARDAAMLLWTDAARYPEVAFSLTSIGPTDGGTVAHGLLTMHGHDRAISIPVEIRDTEGGGRVITGRVAIDQRDWGLSRIRRLLLFTVNPVVTVKFIVPLPLP